MNKIKERSAMASLLFSSSPCVPNKPGLKLHQKIFFPKHLMNDDNPYSNKSSFTKPF